jgi:hypothetical protein
MLRCNRCERPICTSCAVLTDTGYRCKECVRGLQKTFDTARWTDYPMAFVVAAGLSLLGSYIASFLGFFTIFIAPIAGVLTAETIRWAVRRRRSRLLWQVAVAGVITGALPLLLMRLLPLLMGNTFALFSLLWPGLYLFLVASTTYYRLSGIQIR